MAGSRSLITLISSFRLLISPILHLLSFIKITADKSVLRDEFIRGSTLFKGQKAFPSTRLTQRLRTQILSSQISPRQLTNALPSSSAKAAFSPPAASLWCHCKRYSFRSQPFSYPLVASWLNLQLTSLTEYAKTHTLSTSFSKHISFDSLVLLSPFQGSLLSTSAAPFTAAGNRHCRQIKRTIQQADSLSGDTFPASCKAQTLLRSRFHIHLGDFYF